MMSGQREQPDTTTAGPTDAGRTLERRDVAERRPRELGGPGGPEPTRFGDWERAGRCIDF